MRHNSAIRNTSSLTHDGIYSNEREFTIHDRKQFGKLGFYVFFSSSELTEDLIFYIS